MNHSDAQLIFSKFTREIHTFFIESIRSRVERNSVTYDKKNYKILMEVTPFEAPSLNYDKIEYSIKFKTTFAERYFQHLSAPFSNNTVIVRITPVSIEFENKIAYDSVSVNYISYPKESPKNVSASRALVRKIDSIISDVLKIARMGETYTIPSKEFNDSITILKGHINDKARAHTKAYALMMPFRLKRSTRVRLENGEYIDLVGRSYMNNNVKICKSTEIYFLTKYLESDLTRISKDPKIDFPYLTGQMEGVRILTFEELSREEQSQKIEEMTGYEVRSLFRELSSKLQEISKKVKTKHGDEGLHVFINNLPLSGIVCSDVDSSIVSLDIKEFKTLTKY